MLREDAQRGALADAGLAHRQGKAAFADLVFDAPAEALDLRGHPQGRGGQLGGEGVELEAIEIEESFVHDGFCGFWG